MADDFLTEADLMSKWGVTRQALNRLVATNRLRASELEGKTVFSEADVAAFEQSAPENFLDRDEIMQELQLNKSELDELVKAARLIEYNFGAGARFSAKEVDDFLKQKKPTGLEKKPTTQVSERPTEVEKQPTKLEEVASEDIELFHTRPTTVEGEAKPPTTVARDELARKRPTSIEEKPVQKRPTTFEEVEGKKKAPTIEELATAPEKAATTFDFSEELETELKTESRQEGEEAAKGPGAEAPEAEIITDMLELGEESAEEDLLGDIIEDVGGEVMTAEKKPEPLELGGTEDVTAELTGESTVGAETSEDVTAEITQLEEETLGGEEEELSDFLTPGAEGTAAGEEFPFAPTVAPAAETPVGGLMIALLIAIVVVQIVAGMFAMDNAVSPKESSTLTSWNPFLSK